MATVHPGHYESLNPATGESLGAVSLIPPERIPAVVEAVTRVQPLWALLRPVDRARYMRRAAQAVIDEFDSLLDLLAREQGRPRAEIAALELLPAIDALVWIADDGARVLSSERVGVHRSMFPVKRARVTYEPLGVVAVIGAGSAPFAQPLAQLAAALVAGNGVAFKPARRACLAGESIARVLGRAGLPEGLVRLVHGGAEAGVALAGAPVGKVLFTGSRATGRSVARACVSQGREVALELGGKDAMLVLADANVPAAISGALWAGCAGAGQARGSVERVYVAREVADRFITGLAHAAGGLRVGDPLAEGTQLGPLVSHARRAYVDELVDDAVEQGAARLGGGPIDVPGLSGAFYAPTVVTAVGADMRIMREKLAGPVLAVQVIDSVGEAIALVNESDYALGASVWTADRYAGQRIARELRAGMVWLNDHLPAPMLTQGPWGAAPGAGLGRTLGRAGLRACVNEKLITWDPPATRGLWWMPYSEQLTRAAHAVALLRSSRDSDRERGWRQAGPMARTFSRAFGGLRRR